MKWLVCEDVVLHWTVRCDKTSTTEGVHLGFCASGCPQVAESVFFFFIVPWVGKMTTGGVSCKGPLGEGLTASLP